MSSLIIELPRGAVHTASTLDWLLQQSASDAVVLRVQNDSDSIVVAAVADGVERNLLSVPCPVADSTHGMVDIAPGVRLAPPEPAELTRFLREQWRALDHIGINFSQQVLDETQWRDSIVALGSRVPAYRLDVGSANDIVFLLLDTDAAEPTVIELVYDRSAAQSSVHFCVRAAADRAQLEREFAAPYGAYKPGDEAFFRSVALPQTLALPAYVDLAFSDAQIAPWPQIVQTMGQRVA